MSRLKIKALAELVTNNCVNCNPLPPKEKYVGNRGLPWAAGYFASNGVGVGGWFEEVLSGPSKRTVPALPPVRRLLGACSQIDNSFTTRRQSLRLGIAESLAEASPK